jgi:hypothetical protein
LGDVINKLREFVTGLEVIEKGGSWTAENHGCALLMS